MVMPYYEGPTLKRALAELGRPPTEAELRTWLRPLLDALAVMHAARCYHRDIAPDNILLTPNGPLLLDFGAARRVIGDMTHALTVMLKPGAAPIEQYGEMSAMTQGAWTAITAPRRRAALAAFAGAALLLAASGAYLAIRPASAPAAAANEATTATATAAPKPATPRATASSKCSDTPQRASLEPLTASEAEFLKKECR